MSNGFRLFKPTYKDRKGKSQVAAKWYCEFRDHNERVRRLPAFTSKAASEEFGRNIVNLVEYHKGTGGQIDPALSRWLAALPQRTREKLVGIRLLDPERVAVSKPLADHLADFEKALTAKGNSPFHVETVTGRTRRIIDSCRFRTFSDISASKVMEYVSGLRADTEERRGLSAQTASFYIGAIKQFCRWMVRDRRAAESPVSHLQGLNVKTDRRRDRRAFTVEELRQLLKTTSEGPERHGMDGAERALLYRLAVESGLRAGELRSLTRASFGLGGDAPTVTVEAAYSKHRREDTLPLRPELASQLKSFLASLAPATPAFRMPADRKTAAEMFRADVSAAREEWLADAAEPQERHAREQSDFLAYRDAAGLVADFHALRHTFISNLARGGVHPKLAQALARHSTITLTMDRYSHTLIGEQANALDVLPDLSTPARQGLRATGTSDAESSPAVLADCLALSGRPGSIRMGADGRSGPSPIQPLSLAPAGFSPENQGVGSVCTSGGGPGLQNQRAY